MNKYREFMATCFSFFGVTIKYRVYVIAGFYGLPTSMAFILIDICHLIKLTNEQRISLCVYK